MNPKLATLLQKAGRFALLTGIVAAVLCGIGAAYDRAQFFQSWLFAWLFFTGISLGSLVIIMMQAITGGAWGVAVRRPSEAAMLTLPLMALLFFPVLFGAHDLFPWSHENLVKSHSEWMHKRAYLNVPFFALRAAIYFIIAFALAFYLRRWSVMQDKRMALAMPVRWTEKLSAVGIVTYVLCMNGASTDWVMSLEPDWYSSIFVVVFMAGQFLSALAFMTALVTFLGSYEPLLQKLTVKHFADLGNMLLAFVIFWAYVSFSQFLIMWSGNLPKEISWYLHRSAPSWKWTVIILSVLQFFLPFSLLILRTMTRKRERLCAIAIIIVLANLLALYWQVAPAFHPEGIHIHWLDIAALCAVGGFWKALFIRLLMSQPLWPLNLEEAPIHG